MAANTYGRQVIVPLTNKSGGGVIAGDVVIIDTGNNDAFTTTTTAGFTGGVGIAQETIANNVVGRVLTQGYAALVLTSASVTRGHFGATHTVAKQAASAGANRGVGTFCQFLTGGTTPDALVYPVDLLGSSLTNPMTSVGDIIQGAAAGAPARLASPLAGKVLTGAGVTTSVLYAYPPGYEFDYAQYTADVSITATTEGTANTVVTGGAVTYDGSTVVLIEFFAPYAVRGTTYVRVLLADGGTAIGWLTTILDTDRGPVYVARRLTPSAAAHTYSIEAFVDAGTGTVAAGAGGTADHMPGFIRITRA